MDINSVIFITVIISFFIGVIVGIAHGYWIWNKEAEGGY
jgi:ABC-type xylose transport system permease subunit